MLHVAHLGIEATKKRARQTIYWPGILSDVVNLVSSCGWCATRLPAQYREPMRLRPPATPATPAFESVGVDLFTYGGFQFLAYIDSLTHWPEIHRWSRTPTSHDVIAVVKRYFISLGVLVSLQSDNRSQFVFDKFRTFLNT